ncbi:MAG: hypothetical protein AAFW76_12755 [Pseudomonadota bacterium]
MLTFKDCVGLCDLTEDEVDAISHHEHLPGIVALELGDFLLHQPRGAACLRRLLEDNIAQAAARRDFRQATHLMGVLRGFVARNGVKATARDA